MLTICSSASDDCMHSCNKALVYVTVGFLTLQAIAAMERSGDYIKPYDGSTEIATWLKKVKLVARIKKITDLAAFIPLYLEGPAFEVYDQLSDKAKEDGNAIEGTLIQAFGQNKFAAYDVFRQRNWSAGEAVDVYLSDLRRLAKLAEIDSDELICCAFICGLPSDISSQLRAGSRISASDLSEIVKRARVLMDERIQGAMVAVGSTKTGYKASKFSTSNMQRRIECYACGGNHHVRYCKQVREITCWRCQRVGHIAKNCPSNYSGNGNGKLPAPAVSPEA